MSAPRRRLERASLGGREEERKFRAMYVATLVAYRLAFEEEPPEDVWPDVHARFGGR